MSAEMSAGLGAAGLTAGVLGSVVVGHVVALRLFRRWASRSAGADSALYAAIAGVGLVAVAVLVGQPAREAVPPQSRVAFHLSAAAFYLAGCITYLEVRSLLSRGYSLRILVDLAAQGGAARVDRLKAGYGDGMGIPGLLARRVRTLERLGLLRFEGERVGPLTPAGRVVAALTVGLRHLLRLDLVG